jgi:LAO/AO transport system kinase
VENQDPAGAAILRGLDQARIDSCLVVGITGPPGAGKSTLTAGLVGELRRRGQRLGIVAVDPSSPISGGALLGDRIRMMDHVLDPEVVVRSMATRGRLGGLCSSAGAAVRIMAASGCRTVIIETVGTGQSEMDIIRLADITVMVLAPGFGDDIQAMKAGILEVADLLVVNKGDRDGAAELLLDLAAVFPRPEDRDLRLLRTVASEERGLDLLAERILMLAEQYRQGTTLAERRRRSFILETVDWTVELLRPRLTKLAETATGGLDPRLSAEKILARLGQELDND